MPDGSDVVACTSGHQGEPDVRWPRAQSSALDDVHCAHLPEHCGEVHAAVALVARMDCRSRRPAAGAAEGIRPQEPSGSASGVKSFSPEKNGHFADWCCVGVCSTVGGTGRISITATGTKLLAQRQDTGVYVCV